MPQNLPMRSLIEGMAIAEFPFEMIMSIFPQGRAFKIIVSNSAIS